MPSTVAIDEENLRLVFFGTEFAQKRYIVIALTEGEKRMDVRRILQGDLASDCSDELFSGHCEELICVPKPSGTSHIPSYLEMTR